jgi:hypothetical protein
MDAARGGFVPSLRIDGGMVRPTRRRLNMNAYVTTEIRELTAQELDQVTGGRGAEMDSTELAFASFIGAWAISTALCCLIEWLFG